MGLLSVTSPHVRQPGDTGAFMRQVIYATVPGALVLTWFFGWGVLVNLLIAITTALISEALVLRLRQRSPVFFLKDYSAVLTAVLLALAIPPTVPWWVTVVGVSFAIIFAKHLYGGLGSNPFNPAMVGYVLLLISFPLQMTSWLPPAELVSTQLGFGDQLLMSFNAAGLPQGIDAYTMATPLDSVKTWAGNEEKLASLPVLQGYLAGIGWEWVNAAFLLGGLYLLACGIISWQIPVAVLLGLAIPAQLFHWLDPLLYSAVPFHLLSGATMLGAFFIATDPVTACTSNKGRLIYGACIGVLVFVIRTWGGYPDAMAFAVLMMNLAAPTIDYYTQPRTYGHQVANKGLAKK